MTGYQTVTLEGTGSDACGATERKPTLHTLLAAALVCLMVLAIPREPLTTDCESSWSGVLGYAQQTALQFGSQIITPYGPWGFLTTAYLPPHAVGLRLLADVVLSATVASGLCLLGWRLSLISRVLVIGLFALVVCGIRYNRQDLLINVGLLCWGLLCFVGSQRRSVLYAVILTVLAIMCSLTKFTCLVVAVVTVSAVVFGFFLSGKYWAGVVMMVCFVLGLCGGWALAGQDWRNLPHFVRAGLMVSGGYVQAMGLEPSRDLLAGGVLVGTSAFAVSLLWAANAKDGVQQRSMRWRLTVLAWLVSLLFVTWKHGFVRADRHHLIFFFGFAPVLALVLACLATGSKGAVRWTRGLALGCTACSAITLQYLVHPPYLDFLRPFEQAFINARTLVQPSAYFSQMKYEYDLERYRAALPEFRQKIGRATVDVFGNYQIYALFNGFNYRPRPVFQSYTAYSAPLMRLNEAFYLSESAPEYVLVRLGAIDGRFPPLEDSLAFRNLLINYDLEAAEGQFLLLKSKSREAPKLKLLAEGAVGADERIDLVQYAETNLWMEIQMEQTIAGGLRQFLYQPSQMRLAVWRGQEKVGFRAPASMMEAGFLASPVITNNANMSDFYTGRDSIRPSGYSIELSSGGDVFWKRSIKYRIYSIDNTLAKFD